MSLSLAAISAITLLAYYHPHAYKKIYFPLVVILLFALTGVGLWHMSATYTFTALIPHIDPQRLEDSKKAVDALRPPFFTIFIFVFAAFFYVNLLLFLPEILQKKGDDKPEGPQPEKDAEKP